ncbi:hypothetical protein FAI40_08435 [Acetobacteraceae bacterium]|nr:hypothetical protein FAI40_08435 [Acetobacteraceae bacterium]
MISKYFNSNTKCFILLIAAIYGYYIAGNGTPWIMDDPMRAAVGYDWFNGWDFDGRPMSTVLYQLLTLGTGFLPLSPLSQIAGSILITLSALVFISIYQKENENKYYNLIALVPLFSPILAANLVWVFDSFTMSAAMLLAVVAFKCSLNRSLGYFLIASLWMALSLLTYQPAIHLFVICLFFNTYISIINDEDKDLKKIVRNALISGGVLIVGLLTYKIFAHPQDYLEKHLATYPKGQIITGVSSNIVNFYHFLEQCLNGPIFYPIKATLIIYLISFFILVFMSKRTLYTKIALVVCLPVGLIISLFGCYLPLSSPMFEPRLLLSFSFLLLLPLLQVNCILTKLNRSALAEKIQIGFSVVLLWVGTVNIVELHNALAAEFHNLDFNMAPIARDLNAFMSENPNAQWSMEGYIKKSNLRNRYAHSNGIVDTTEVWSHLPGFFESRFSIDNAVSRFCWDTTGRTKPQDPVINTAVYSIYKDENMIWVVVH